MHKLWAEELYMYKYFSRKDKMRKECTDAKRGALQMYN